MNFPVGTSEKILKKLDDMIKEKPDDLIVHGRTNDIANNVNLLTNVKKIFNKVSKYSPSTSITFHLSLTAKTRRTFRKHEQIRMPVYIFFLRKEICFIYNSGIKEFNLGKRKLLLDKKRNSAFAKKLFHDINRRD